MSKEVEIIIKHNHLGPGRQCVGWYHKDEKGEEWGGFIVRESDSKFPLVEFVDGQKRSALKTLGEDVNFTVRENPESIHICIIFEDGKCVHCGKIPEYPVLEEAE